MCWAACFDEDEEEAVESAEGENGKKGGFILAYSNPQLAGFSTVHVKRCDLRAWNSEL